MRRLVGLIEPSPIQNRLIQNLKFWLKAKAVNLDLDTILDAYST